MYHHLESYPFNYIQLYINKISIWSYHTVWLKFKLKQIHIIWFYALGSSEQLFHTNRITRSNLLEHNEFMRAIQNSSIHEKDLAYSLLSNVFQFHLYTLQFLKVSFRIKCKISLMCQRQLVHSRTLEEIKYDDTIQMQIKSTCN